MEDVSVFVMHGSNISLCHAAVYIEAGGVDIDAARGGNGRKAPLKYLLGSTVFKAFRTECVEKACNSVLREVYVKVLPAAGNDHCTLIGGVRKGQCFFAVVRGESYRIRVADHGRLGVGNLEHETAAARGCGKTDFIAGVGEILPQKPLGPACQQVVCVVFYGFAAILAFADQRVQIASGIRNKIPDKGHFTQGKLLAFAEALGEQPMPGHILNIHKISPFVLFFLLLSHHTKKVNADCLRNERNQ